MNYIGRLSNIPQHNLQELHHSRTPDPYYYYGSVINERNVYRNHTDYLNFLNHFERPQEDWRNKYIEHWRTSHTISWIMDCASVENINILDIPWSNFEITGFELMHLDHQQLLRRLGHPGVEPRKSEMICGKILDKLIMPVSKCIHKAIQTDFSDNEDSSRSESEIDVSSCSIDDIKYVKKIYSTTGNKTKNSEERDAKSNRKPAAILEFLVKLLLDKNSCPSEIKWEDYSQGMFRIVNPAAVVQRWNNRNKNTIKDYDVQYFYRAMRYHYKKGAISPVQGKRSVWKFGRNVPDYTTDDPNFRKANSDNKFYHFKTQEKNNS